MNAPDVVSRSAGALLASAAFACAAPLESTGLDVELDEAVDVDVEAETLRLLVSLREANLAGAPVEGATCAVARASRVPIEAVTDARGLAHVELDGWTETLSVSCARGHVTSVVGLRASDVVDRVVDRSASGRRQAIAGTRQAACRTDAAVSPRRPGNDEAPPERGFVAA